MKLRYGIPLTMLLLAAVWWASGNVPFNAYYLLVGVSSIWVAIDSRVIGIQRYQTQLALPALPIAAATIVAWPFVFPVYLRTRRRISTGEIREGQASRRVNPFILALVGLVVVLEVMGWWLAHGIRQELLPVAGIGQQFHVPASLNLNDGRYLAVSLPEAAVPDSAKEQLAERVARYVWAHYPRATQLQSVAVEYVDVHRWWIITATNSTQYYRWNRGELDSLERASGPTRK